MTDQPTFERKPGAPAWEEGKEYACWFRDASVDVLVVAGERVYCHGQEQSAADLRQILWHVELPPEPPKRLKPGLYKVKCGVRKQEFLFFVSPYTGYLWCTGESVPISRNGELPPGYEVLDAYAAGWEEGE